MIVNVERYKNLYKYILDEKEEKLRKNTKKLIEFENLIIDTIKYYFDFNEFKLLVDCIDEVVSINKKEALKSGKPEAEIDYNIFRIKILIDGATLLFKFYIKNGCKLCDNDVFIGNISIYTRSYSYKTDGDREGFKKSLGKLIYSYQKGKNLCNDHKKNKK